jgi:hypothetical protein
MDVNQKIIALMNGMNLDQHTVELDETSVANVTVVKSADGPKLKFTLIRDGIEYRMNNCNNLIKTDGGEIRFSMTRFYFSLLRMANAKIKSLSNLIDKAL